MTLFPYTTLFRSIFTNPCCEHSNVYEECCSLRLEWVGSFAFLVISNNEEGLGIPSKLMEEVRYFGMEQRMESLRKTTCIHGRGSGSTSNQVGVSACVVGISAPCVGVSASKALGSGLSILCHAGAHSIYPLYCIICVVSFGPITCIVSWLYWVFKTICSNVLGLIVIQWVPNSKK